MIMTLTAGKVPPPHPPKGGERSQGSRVPGETARDRDGDGGQPKEAYRAVERGSFGPCPSFSARGTKGDPSDPKALACDQRTSVPTGEHAVDRDRGGGRALSRKAAGVVQTCSPGRRERGSWLLSSRRSEEEGGGADGGRVGPGAAKRQVTRASGTPRGPRRSDPGDR